MRSWFCFIFFSLFFPKIHADMFAPLSLLSTASTERFVLEKYDRIPYRVQFRGSVDYPSGPKYIFCVDNQQLVYLSCCQRAPEGFRLVQIKDGGKTAWIEDEILKKTLPLFLGENTPLPDVFKAVIYDKMNNKRYTISENTIQLNDNLFLQRSPRDDSVYILEKNADSHCHAYVIRLEEKKCF